MKEKVDIEELSWEEHFKEYPITDQKYDRSDSAGAALVFDCGRSMTQYEEDMALKSMRELEVL